MRRFHTLVLLPLLTLSLPAAADDWSRFRGPNGSGISPSAAPPVEFSPQRNKEWEAAVPFGRSSPVLGDGRLFLTAVEDGKLVTFAFDRATGEQVWRREIGRRQKAELFRATDSATPTPVTDGKNVYVFFHEAGLVSYGPSGKQRWRVDLGPFRNFYGIASSPVIAGDLVVMVCDQAQGSFIVAVEKDTGVERWRTERSGRLESYSTPVLLPDAARPAAVLVFGSHWIDAYGIETGRTLWSVGGLGTGPVSSPVLAGGTVFVSAPDQAEEGWPELEPLLKEHDANGDGRFEKSEVETMWIGGHFGWLDADGDGVITAEEWAYIGKEMVNESWGVQAVRLPQGDARAETLWSYRQNVAYIPSPLVRDGVFYMVKDDIVTALDAVSGELLRRGRLNAGVSPKVYASPVTAGGHIYIATLEGKVAVLEAGREWKVVQTNDLGEEIWATPAIADGRLYVRTKSKLYSFAAPRESKPDPAKEKPVTAEKPAS